MEFDFEEIAANIQKEPVRLRHQDLTRVNESVFRSKCPKCEDGILFVQRDHTTFNIQSEDMCSWCGHRFIYTDVREDTITLEYKK
jgi:hypothetical protein